MQQLQSELDALKEKQDELSNEWLELQEQLEEIASKLKGCPNEASFYFFCLKTNFQILFVS